MLQVCMQEYDALDLLLGTLGTKAQPQRKEIGYLGNPPLKIT